VSRYDDVNVPDEMDPSGERQERLREKLKREQARIDRERNHPPTPEVLPVPESGDSKDARVSELQEAPMHGAVLGSTRRRGVSPSSFAGSF
jgi:hypothetical protein